MKISGIYKIESKLKPNKFYIGSAVDIRRRWAEHLSELRHSKHHSKKLQNHYNKYGIGDLLFSIVLSCEKNDILNIEQYFLDFYNPWFNTCKTAGNCLGVKHTIATRKKMSKNSKGVRHSEETKIKIGNATRGHKVSEEARKIMSESKKGKSPWNKGKKNIYSIETINKFKLAAIGRKSGMKGKKHSEESKKKMSETRKLRWSKRVA